MKVTVTSLNRQLAATTEENKKLSQEIATLKNSLADCSAQFSHIAQENKELAAKVGEPVRRRLRETRKAITHKFSVGGHEGYMTVGLFDNGEPGELFITMAKEGSTIGGLMDTIGTLTSMAFQYGVSVEILAKKFSHQRFEPSGFTNNPELKQASSIIDYIFRWLEKRFTAVENPISLTAQPRGNLVAA